MTWHSYTWHELDDVRKLKVAVKVRGCTTRPSLLLLLLKDDALSASN